MLWGAYHGLFLILERLFLARQLEAAPRPLQHAYLLMLAMCGWVLFRADTLPQAGALYAAMSGMTDATGPAWHLLDPRVLAAVCLGCLFAMPVAPRIAQTMASIESRGGTAAGWAATASAIARPLMTGTLLALGLAGLAAGTHNPFIYFRF